MKGVNALHSRLPKKCHILKDDQMNMLNDIEKEERDMTTLWYLLSVIRMEVTEYLEVNLPIYTDKYAKIMEQVLSNAKSCSYVEVTIWKRKILLQKSAQNDLGFNVVVNVKED